MLYMIENDNDIYLRLDWTRDLKGIRSRGTQILFCIHVSLNRTETGTDRRIGE